MTQLSIFDIPPAPASRYPNVPGFKRKGTSEAAADLIAPVVSKLKAKCLANLRSVGPATADELAVRIGENFLNIRPRMTELEKQGYVEVVGERPVLTPGEKVKKYNVYAVVDGKLFA